MMPGQGISNLQANAYVNRRTEAEIEGVLGACEEAADTGESRYPGKSYEQGVEAALTWAFGMSNDHPTEGK